MFGMFESLTKAVVGVAKLPVAAVADAVTLGGSLNDREKPYTAEAVGEILDNLADATNPRR